MVFSSPFRMNGLIFMGLRVSVRVISRMLCWFPVILAMVWVFPLCLMIMFQGFSVCFIAIHRKPHTVLRRLAVHRVLSSATRLV